MDCNEIITNIIMPIVSALIGGGLTLIGVLITIKSENKKRKEEIRIANKPLFYVIDPHQDYDYKNAVDFAFYQNDSKKNEGFFTLIFKNTDKAILILDYIEINGIKYYSKYGNVVDKSVVFNIYIYADKNTFKKSNNEIIFSIKDSLNNNYKYNLEYTDENGKIIKGYYEIK